MIAWVHSALLLIIANAFSVAEANSDPWQPFYDNFSGGKQPDGEVRLISNVTIVNPVGYPSQENATVTLIGDRIHKITSGDVIDTPKGAERIDGSGKWLVPGLIDAHVHFDAFGSLYEAYDGELPKAPPLAEDNSGLVFPALEYENGRWEARSPLTKKKLRERLDDLLRSGVTSARGLGEECLPAKEHVQSFRDVVAGQDVAPRVQFTCLFISPVLSDPQMPWLVATPEQGVAAVRAQVEAGLDLIKI